MRTDRRAKLALLTALAMWLSLCAVSASADGPQRLPVSRPGRAGKANVRALLRLYLTAGQRVPFRAEQTTRLLDGRTLEAAQIVTRAGKDRERIEYLAPPHLRGEVILRVGSRVFHFRPRPEPHVTESESPPDVMDIRLRNLLTDVSSGRIGIHHVGEQVIAGRRAEIVEITPSGSGPIRRLWIDASTGVRLRHETVDVRGIVTATSYYTSITYHPDLNPEDFRPRALASLARSTVLPGALRVGSVEAAQREVAFRIRVPNLPEGFELKDVWVIGPRRDRAVSLHFSDGVNWLRVSQRRIAPGAARAGSEAAGQAPVVRQGFAYWISGDMLFTITGPVRPGSLRDALRSLE